MTAPTITEFLLARYDEAETKARDWWTPTEDCPAHTVGRDPNVVYVDTRWEGLPEAWPVEEFNARYMTRVDPDPAVIKDLEAKRAIVAWAQGYVLPLMSPGTPEHGVIVLRYLASVYDTHPDYQESWRP